MNTTISDNFKKFKAFVKIGKFDEAYAELNEAIAMAKVDGVVDQNEGNQLSEFFILAQKYSEAIGSDMAYFYDAYKKAYPKDPLVNDSGAVRSQTVRNQILDAIYQWPKYRIYSMDPSRYCCDDFLKSRGFSDIKDPRWNHEGGNWEIVAGLVHSGQPELQSITEVTGSLFDVAIELIGKDELDCEKLSLITNFLSGFTLYHWDSKEWTAIYNLKAR